MDKHERHALLYASDKLIGYLSKAGVTYELTYAHVPMSRMSPRQLRTTYQELKAIYEQERAD